MLKKYRGSKRFSVKIDSLQVQNSFEHKSNRNIVTIIENSFNCSEDISTNRIRLAVLDDNAGVSMLKSTSFELTGHMSGLLGH